jgi:hypothetical protein
MQRSCNDVNSPYKRKNWTNSGSPLVNSVLWLSSLLLSLLLLLATILAPAPCSDPLVLLLTTSFPLLLPSFPTSPLLLLIYSLRSQPYYPCYYSLLLSYSFSLLLPCSCSLPSFLFSVLLLFLFFFTPSNHIPTLILRSPPPKKIKKININWEMKEDSSRTVCVAAFELMRNNVGWRKSFNAVSMWNDTEASVLRSAHSQQQSQLFLALLTIVCTEGHKEMSSIFPWPIVPSYMSPNAGRGGGVTGSQPMSTAVHMEQK